jgi:carbamoyl-phosphate synthase large subunit
VPFVSKAVGVPLAKVACRLMLGERLADMELPLRRNPGHVSVKEAVLPFGRFPRADARDKPAATQLAASLHDLGFKVLATGGTAQAIRRMGVPVERIKKLSEGSPNVVERIEAGGVELVINTPTGSGARADGYEIRRAAVTRGIPCITTMSGASAAQRAIRAKRGEEPGVVSLQELHGLAPARRTAVG